MVFSDHPVQCHELDRQTARLVENYLVQGKKESESLAANKASVTIFIFNQKYGGELTKVTV